MSDSTIIISKAGIQQVLGYLLVTAVPDWCKDPWEADFIGQTMPYVEIEKTAQGTPLYRIPAEAIGIHDKKQRWEWIRSENCELVEEAAPARDQLELWPPLAIVR